MPRFSVLIASDDDHEKVFVEIYCNDKFVAAVSQERGPDDLEIEFPGPDLLESEILRRVALADFVATLDKAAKRLARGEP